MRELIDRLDVISRDREFIQQIFRSDFNRTEQMTRVRNLLLPRELKRYDAGMRLTELLGNASVGPERAHEVDLTVVRGLPLAAAAPLKVWLQEHRPRNFRVYGSFVDWLYTHDAPPEDIDIATDTPERDAKEVADLIHEASGLPIEVIEYSTSVEPIIVGYRVTVDSRAVVDIHHWDTYTRRMPYDWETKSPVVIEDIPMERLSEQLLRRGVILLNPGVGLEGRSRVGPEAAQTSWRVRDVERMNSTAGFLIGVLREQGYDATALEAVGHLKTLLEEPTKGYPTVAPLEKQDVADLDEYNEYGGRRVKARKLKRRAKPRAATEVSLSSLLSELRRS